MTLSGALAEGRRRLAGHSTTPELDAEVLLAHLLNGSRSSLIAAGRDPLDAQTCQRFDQLIQRRKQGEPVAYLTGEKEFWSLTLKVTPDVLVPRPETELLVEWAFEILSFRRKPAGVTSRESPALAPSASEASVLDLGTGSGAIALAIAREHPQAGVTATDLSAAALEVARTNSRRLGISNVTFAQGAFFKALDPGFRRDDGCFDLILSNPPYVAENDPHLTDLRFEPALALTAGQDGLSALRKITADAGKFLKPGGWLLLEHGAEQGAAVRELFQLVGFRNIATRRDLAGHERATAGQIA
jgi:release factor glutamine methyltransferase